MKKIFVFLLNLVLIVSNFNFVFAEKNHYITEEEFLNLVENSPRYLEYEDLIYNSDYEVVEIQKSEVEYSGRMARIEVEYNQENSKIVNQMSYLVFVYEYETGNFIGHLVDNSQLYETGKITIKNFNNETQQVYDVSNEDFYKEYVSSIESDLEKLTLEETNIVEETNSNEFGISSTRDPICFQCTRYETSPHNLSNNCMTAFSWACGAVGTIPAAGLPGFLICGGVAVLSCWVPAYRICVAGSWQTTCPV